MNSISQSSPADMPILSRAGAPPATTPRNGRQAALALEQPVLDRAAEASKGPALLTDELTKVFPLRRQWLQSGSIQGEKIAVDHVTLSVGAGEIFGLVGPNGAGKTTLIRMLCTLLRPTAGRAEIAGHDTVRDEGAVRRLVGLVASNERSFYWRLTGRQNLSFFAGLYHLPKSQVAPWLEELYDLLDLRAIIDRRFDEYSTGQKQRLAIARGLLSKPRVLLMDEPTKGVDPLGAARLVTIIRERLLSLWRPTILITSHNLTEIERLCDRVALMHQGRIIAQGGLDELRGLVGERRSWRLAVAGLSEAQARAAARHAGALDPIEIEPGPELLDLVAHFDPAREGLPDLVTALVERQARILDCRELASSFDDVFMALIARQADAGLASV